jgi:Kef-type K+ transport system membrane component KefB
MSALAHASVHVAVAYAVILASCWVGATLLRPLRQPRVVGEILVGVALGPSLLGWAAPHLQAWIFPRQAVTVLRDVSQISIVCFMFMAGLSLDLESVRRQLRSALAVGLAGIATPFVLGALLVTPLMLRGGLFGVHVTVQEATLFLGTALSITALPVLARLVADRGASTASAGATALAAAALNDVVAWCLLALVLAEVRGAPGLVVATLGGAVPYLLVLVGVLRPSLARASRDSRHRSRSRWPRVAIVLATLAASAWYTDVIGLHPIFGAFALGISIPRAQLRDDLRRVVRPLATTFLLPLFFVYSGLHTRIGEAVNGDLLPVTVAVIGLASAGKLIGCSIAAVATGQPRRQALQIGVLMNTRGVTELVLLNISLDGGVITVPLFSVLVVMALMTTLMASPLLDLISARWPG